jgi:hypothetical protein
MDAQFILHTKYAKAAQNKECTNPWHKSCLPTLNNNNISSSSTVVITSDAR